MNILGKNIQFVEMAEEEIELNRVLDKLSQIDSVREHIATVLRETDWSMLFSNTDFSVTFVEAKAKLIEADKKFIKIQQNLIDDCRTLKPGI